MIGYDADAARVHDIAAGQLPVVEPDLDELARGVAGRITFTSQAGDLAACGRLYLDGRWDRCAWQRSLCHFGIDHGRIAALPLTV